MLKPKRYAKLKDNMGSLDQQLLWLDERIADFQARIVALKAEKKDIQDDLDFLHTSHDVAIAEYEKVNG